jgi:hypothetical protein
VGILKISKCSVDKFVNEIEIYKLLFSKMPKYIMQHLLSFSLPYHHYRPESEIGGQFLDLMLGCSNFLLVEKASGKSLKTWIQTNLEGRKESFKTYINHVILQVAYVLSLFEDYEIMHNDLHSGNLFVDEYETECLHELSVGSTRREFKSPIHVKIFDFDLSYSKELRNRDVPDKDHCAFFSICPYFQKNKDWNQFLFWTAREILMYGRGVLNENEISEFNKNLILLGDKNFLHTRFDRLVHPGIPCLKDRPGFPCLPMILDPEKGPKECLASFYQNKK